MEQRPWSRRHLQALEFGLGLAALALWTALVDLMARGHGRVLNLSIGDRHHLADLYHRLADASMAWHHGPLYASRPGAFTYPPVVAFLFAPLRAVGFRPAAVLWTAVSLGSLALVIALLAWRWRQVELSRAWLWSCLVALPLLVAASVPVKSNLLWGQLGLMLLALVVLDLFVLPRRWQGLLVGLAAAVKLLPIIFVLWFVARRSWPALLRALGTFGLLGAVGWVLRPSYSSTYFFHIMLSGHARRAVDGAGHDAASWFSGAGMVYNQSIKALLARPPFLVEQGSLWLVFAVPVLVAGCAIAWKLLSAGEEPLAFVALSLAAVLAEPVSWLHYYVFVVVLPVLAWRYWEQAKALALSAWAYVAVTAINLEAPDLGRRSTTWPGLLAFFVTNAYVLGGIALLAVLGGYAFGRGSAGSVPPAGLEPALSAPEADALSAELRGLEGQAYR